jgi:hypothetical protein
VFEVGGDVLQPQLAHNLCRLIAEQDSELHATAVRMFMQVRSASLSLCDVALLAGRDCNCGCVCWWVSCHLLRSMHWVVGGGVLLQGLIAEQDRECCTQQQCACSSR